MYMYVYTPFNRCINVCIAQQTDRQTKPAPQSQGAYMYLRTSTLPPPPLGIPPSRHPPGHKLAHPPVHPPSDHPLPTVREQPPRPLTCVQLGKQAGSMQCSAANVIGARVRRNRGRGRLAKAGSARGRMVGGWGVGGETNGERGGKLGFC